MKEKIVWEDGFGIKHHGFLILSKNGYDIIECETCGFAHSIPIPGESELNEYYTNKYYQSDKPDYADQHQKDRDWWKMINVNRYARFERSLGRKGKILDIGCGPGFFLKDGLDLGWEVFGVEPSKEAFEYAQSLKVNCINESFDINKFSENENFDVVIINQALEHIAFPNLLLEDLKRIIKHDGLLSIVVANDFNPLQKIAVEKFGIDEWWAIPPEHLNYFTHESLSNLCVKSGYTVVDLSSTFPIDMFLLMGDQYIGNNKIGNAAHKRRKEFEFSLNKYGNNELLNKFYKSMAEIGLGREIDIICRNNK